MKVAHLDVHVTLIGCGGGSFRLVSESGFRLCILFGKLVSDQFFRKDALNGHSYMQHTVSDWSDH